MDLSISDTGNAKRLTRNPSLATNHHLSFSAIQLI